MLGVDKRANAQNFIKLPLLYIPLSTNNVTYLGAFVKKKLSLGVVWGCWLLGYVALAQNYIRLNFFFEFYCSSGKFKKHHILGGKNGSIGTYCV